MVKKSKKEKQPELYVRKCGNYEFHEIRNPLFIGFLLPLVHDLLRRVPGEANEGYIPEDYLTFITAELAKGNPFVRVFAMMEIETCKYVGFATVIFTECPPPVRVWVDKFHVLSQHANMKVSKEFYLYLEDWIKKLGVDSVNLMTRTRNRVKAFKRLGYETTYAIMRKKL